MKFSSVLPKGHWNWNGGGFPKMTMIRGLKLKRHDFSNRVDPFGAPTKTPESWGHYEDFFFWCVDLPGKTARRHMFKGSWQWKNDCCWEDLTGTRSDRLLFVNGALPGRVGSDERKWLILPTILYIIFAGEEKSYATEKKWSTCQNDALIYAWFCSGTIGVDTSLALSFWFICVFLSLCFNCVCVSVNQVPLHCRSPAVNLPERNRHWPCPSIEIILWINEHSPIKCGIQLKSTLNILYYIIYWLM